MVHKMYGHRLEKGSMTMKCTQVEDLCLANSVMFGLQEFTMGYLFEGARTCLQVFRSWNLEKISKHCKLGLTNEQGKCLCHTLIPKYEFTRQQLQTHKALPYKCARLH